MKNNKYKILVLSDLTKAAKSTLKNSVGLAKMIDGQVDFFYVKKPTEIVEKENQLSAIRTINEKYNKTGKEIENLIKPISQGANITINYKYSFGNIKSEIDNYILKNNPDIIVLGKRKPKLVNFLGDNITQHILNNHKAIVMIADDKNGLDSNKELSLGFLNEINSQKKIQEDLINHTNKPLTCFKVTNKSETLEETKISNPKKPIEYVFDNDGNTLNKISKYLVKSNVNLLFVDREKNNQNSKTQNIINNVNCSLILSN
ncbi:universal stress protein [uncultured Polaribacter sp.]|uniref:universal stress protein n=1 Tax=uncultured Polaribacter sp. TaxID=174711 RepID=UPI002627A6F5|nr:universal stress protein [uncultured Polaribacter sp.]